jgi:hypothetical protein
VAIDTRVITRRASEQVIRHAFELCKRRNKGAPKDGKLRVTAIVKDNVLHGCQFFAHVFFEIGEEYPEIEKDTAIVDAFTQWLIGQPEYYDVVVTTNMFGDIVTDLASVLQGGMGMAVGANVGREARDVRADPRQRAEARRQGQGQPDRDDPGGEGGPRLARRPQAATRGSGARRHRDRGGGGRAAQGRGAADVRPRRRGQGREVLRGRAVAGRGSSAWAGSGSRWTAADSGSLRRGSSQGTCSPPHLA